MRSERCFVTRGDHIKKNFGQYEMSGKILRGENIEAKIEQRQYFNLKKIYNGLDGVVFCFVCLSPEAESTGR